MGKIVLFAQEQEPPCRTQSLKCKALTPILASTAFAGAQQPDLGDASRWCGTVYRLSLGGQMGKMFFWVHKSKKGNARPTQSLAKCIKISRALTPFWPPLRLLVHNSLMISHASRWCGTVYRLSLLGTDGENSAFWAQGIKRSCPPAQSLAKYKDLACAGKFGPLRLRWCTTT
jgi:hypothetical protein